ncbi:MAG TPA: DUF2298 domain-containing protein [Candidatus Limnocylindrales bacterium]|nr:DUF2298 domain-containing protein [Candidatus Limnocylindrales bacterium]
MLPSDICSILQWWLAILILGTGFLPLTFLLFKNFFDKGYIFSKLLSLCILTYVILLLGILHILPFTEINSWLMFFLIASLIYGLTPGKRDLFLVIKQNFLIFVFEELLFLATLFLWAYIHSFNPDIHGLEKYMDYGFINSILRSDYFPPKDMWLTPLFINYYYFGHLVTAVLTRISALSPNITFNLMLSTIFAFCFTQTFSLGANIYSFMKKSEKISEAKRFVSGLLTALLVTFAGNLHIVYGFFKPYTNDKPVPFWDLPFLPVTFPNSYWYPNATRFIHNTIHEFPIYSWVVADLHGHVLDIPFVLLTIAVLLSLFINSEISKPKSDSSQVQKNARMGLLSYFDQRIYGLLLLGFLLAIMYMTNAWDGGIYLLLSILVLFTIYHKNLVVFFLSVFITSVSLALFSLPYNYFFKPFTSGMGILCAPEFLTKIGKIGPFLFEQNFCQHSPWWQLLILYGFFYFFVISFLVFINRTKKLLPTDTFVLLLILLSTFLIILPEFIYLKDIYPAHYRANTMFKLVFQSFIMLSVSCGYIIVRILSSVKLKKINLGKKLLTISYLLLVIGLISLVMTYPYLAINSYYGLDQKDEKGKFKKPAGLDGTKYLKNLYPDDFKAIEWLRKNVAKQPIILEAQGDSYTDYARVSANTGLPTVLGWTVHEWLWRGTYDIPSPRIAEIKTLYETLDLKEAQALLKKYDVEYVFIGTLEYQKYPALSEQKFQKLSKIIYQSQNTKIYKVSP